MMDRSSRQLHLQELDGYRWLEACRSNFRRSPHLGAPSMVVSMRLSEGLKRIQEVRPQTMNNLRALDRQRHRLILGYARLPLVQGPWPPNTCALAVKVAPRGTRKKSATVECLKIGYPNCGISLRLATLVSSHTPIQSQSFNNNIDPTRELQLVQFCHRRPLLPFSSQNDTCSG